MLVRPHFLVMFTAFALALCNLPVYAQQNSLQQRMTSTQFKAAGLDKLSPQELQNLDNWLQSQVKPATRMVDASGKPVFYATGKRSTIRAHVAGQFDGWTGHTLVTLDNGQQWQQIGSDAPQCNSADSPSAKIKPSLFDNWLMYVDGCNDTVHVRRVR